MSSSSPCIHSPGLQNITTASLLDAKTPSPPKECPCYDTKPSDGVAEIMLALWGVRSTLSLPSLPGQLCPGEAAPDSFLSIYIHQPLRTCRTWHEVNFKQGLTGLNSVFFLHLDCLLIVLVGKVFTNGLVGLGSMPGRVKPKTLKMVLDTSFPNIQHYKVRIKGKVEQSEVLSGALPYTSV